jgi:hypothetical protein
MIDILFFVNGTALPENFKERIPSFRFFESTVDNCFIETREMSAIQMSNQIRCAELDDLPDLKHPCDPLKIVCSNVE